jgi:hypothetical protein
VHLELNILVDLASLERAMIEQALQGARDNKTKRQRPSA